jgi:hypothetical protein
MPTAPIPVVNGFPYAGFRIGLIWPLVANLGTSLLNAIKKVAHKGCVAHHYLRKLVVL